MDKATEAIVAVISGAFVVAIVAVLMSSRSQTPSVLTSFGTALSGIIQAAVSPVAASSTGLNP